MPPVEQIFHTLSDYVKDHAVKILTGLVLMGVGWWIGFRRAKANWKKREFYDRLNISLNYIDQGTLAIRTLAEDTCEKIFLNTAASDAIQKAARRTTSSDPLLPLPKEDYWYYLNSVLNALSEQFSAGVLQKEQGRSVLVERYVICLTSEVAGDIRMRKVRAMVIRKSLLLRINSDVNTDKKSETDSPNEKIPTPKFASPNHTTRWETLKFMAAEYQRHPWRFIEAELCS